MRLCSKVLGRYKRSRAKFEHLFNDGQLERYYHNKLHIIRTTDFGFLYDGTYYASLSKVVEKIREGKTGNVSPNKFFDAEELL